MQPKDNAHMLHHPSDTALVTDAFKTVLQAAVRWRRLAATDPQEYARRHKQVVAFEGLAVEVLASSPSTTSRVPAS
jgi:hypothetical protein